MVTRADSALPWVAGAWLTGLWRVALVGGLTTGVVLVWALHDRGAAQVVPVADAEVSVVEVVTPVATVGSDSPAVPASDRGGARA